MSHERLRFNILLNKNNSKNEKITHSSFDPIYADSVYNTHFGIFVNFVGDIEKNGYRLKNLNLYIQNYIGLVSIGFTKIVGFTISKIQGRDVVENFSSGRHIKLYVILKGLCNSFSCDYPEIDKQNFHFIEGDMLEVIPFFEPVDNKQSRIDEDASTRNKTIIFSDSEYQKRDGEDIMLLPNFREKKDLIERLKRSSSSQDIERALVNNNGNVITSQDIAGTFGGQGGGYFCKMKISDIYIR